MGPSSCICAHTCMHAYICNDNKEKRLLIWEWGNVGGVQVRGAGKG